MKGVCTNYYYYKQNSNLQNDGIGNKNKDIMISS